MERRGSMQETRSNLPLPDQLRAVRKQIKELKDEEAELAGEVKIAGKISGAFWEAYVDPQTRNNFDRKAAMAALGSVLDPYFSEKSVDVVKLRALD